MLICPDADHSDGLLDVTMVAVGVAHQADSLVPHRFQGHARRPRRGAHRARAARSPSTRPASTPTPTASTPARCRSRCPRSRRAEDPAPTRYPTPRLSQLTSRGVAAVAVGLQRFVPRGAEHRVEFGGEHVGARRHQRRAAASRRPSRRRWRSSRRSTGPAAGCGTSGARRRLRWGPRSPRIAAPTTTAAHWPAARRCRPARPSW